jgi:hypothetical protein
MVGDPDVTPAPRAGAIPFERDPRHVVLPEDTVNRRGRHVHLMIAGQEHREPLDAVLPFLAQAQNECLELGRDAMRADAGPAPVFAQGPGLRAFGTGSSRSRTCCGRCRRTDR